MNLIALITNPFVYLNCYFIVLPKEAFEGSPQEKTLLLAKNIVWLLPETTFFIFLLLKIDYPILLGN